MKTFRGITTALISPFLKDTIDLSSFKNLLKQQQDAGINNFVISGTTGESPTLSWDEIETLALLAKKNLSEDSNIILGVGTNNTKETIKRATLAEKLNADALLIVTPYYNKPNQQGLYQHYFEVSKSTELPILLYNVPSRTGVDIDISTVCELSALYNVIGIKEASLDLKKGKNLIEKTGDNFLVLSGDDETCFQLIESGADGVISVLSHIIPREMKNIFDKIDREKIKGNESNFEKYLPLTKGLFLENNPVPIKFSLKFLGLISSDEVRLPLVTMSEKNKRLLKNELLALGFING